MARVRFIKPGLFLNDTLAELPIAARYLFSGLWTIADREGRLEDRPRKIKAQLLPFDDEDVDPLLQGLHDKGFILRYQVNGGSYIAIPKWHDHQKPHPRETESTIPPASMCTNTRLDNEGINPFHTKALPRQDLGAEKALTSNADPNSNSNSNSDPDIQELALPEPPPKDIKQKTSRPSKAPDEDAYTYAFTIAQAAGYPEGYTNKAECCKQAKGAMSQKIPCEELAGCVRYMLETNAGFWANQTLTIASAMRQWPAYQKRLAEGWKPGDGVAQKGDNRGKHQKYPGPALNEDPRSYYRSTIELLERREKQNSGSA